MNLRSQTTHIPKGTVLTHMTYTGKESTEDGSSSFKQFYTKRQPWPEMCCMCPGKEATLGAHMAAQVGRDEETGLSKVAHGIMPGCHACNHNLRHSTKTYRALHDTVLVVLSQASLDSINEKQLEATQDKKAGKGKGKEKKGEEKKEEEAKECSTDGCTEPVCSARKPSCGGKSKKGCCVHYRLNKYGQVACRTRKKLLEKEKEKEKTPSPSPPIPLRSKSAVERAKNTANYIVDFYESQEPPLPAVCDADPESPVPVDNRA